MVTTKQEKRKRKKTKSRRPRPPPPVGLAGRAPKRADPTSLVLERQQVGTLIKNARTAGVAINQTAYDAYYDTVAMRSLANQMQRPDVYAMQGLEARRHLRNMVLPSGHGGAREVSTPLVPGPTTDTTPLAADVADQHSDASSSVEFEHERLLDQRLREGAMDAVDVTASPSDPFQVPLSPILQEKSQTDNSIFSISPQKFINKKTQQLYESEPLSNDDHLWSDEEDNQNLDRTVDPNNYPSLFESASDLN